MLATDVAAVLQRAAHTLLAEAVQRGGTIPAHRIETIVYSELLAPRRTTKDWRDVRKLFPSSFINNYPSLLKSLMYTVPVEVQDNVSWYNVLLNLPQAPQERVHIGSSPHEINYKEYFTLVVDKATIEEVMEAVVLFLQTLPEIVNQLFVLGQTTGDRPAVKVPDSLTLLIAQHDSLVVHYQDASLSKTIRAIAEETYRSKGLVLTREFRAETGFDFKAIENRERSSHSQLLAKIMAAHLSRIDLRGRTVEELATWLLSSVEKLNAGTAEQIAKTLART